MCRIFAGWLAVTGLAHFTLAALLQMEPSEQSPAAEISAAAIARHWGVSRAYVAKLGRPIGDRGGKSMPAFTTLAQADAWRSLNCPKSPDKGNSSEGADEGGGKNTRELTTTTTGTGGKAPVVHSGLREDTEVVDISAFLQRDPNYDAAVVRRAEEAEQVAHGLYLRACRTNRVTFIKTALENWNSAAGKARDARASFLKLQEDAKVLVPVDVAMDIMGTELQTLRSLLLKLGERTAQKANPQNPDAAKAAIDAAVDEVFKTMAHAEQIVKAELAS